MKKFVKESLYDGPNIHDELANREFGLDYNQLGPGEQEWVRDEIENMHEDAMGGVSAPMATLNNTPGMGNAQPATTSMNTDGASGSGDAWGDSSLGMQTNEAAKVNINKTWDGKYFNITTNELDYNEYLRLGDNLDSKQLDFKDSIKKEYNIEHSPDVIKYPNDVSYSNYDYNTGEATFTASTLKDIKNWLNLYKNEVYSDSPILFENNLNPYDKIGAMMAKKMGVAQPFKKKDGRTNTIEQSGWEELDEEQPNNFTDIDDYVSNPNKVMNTAKKRKLGKDAKLTESEKPFGIITLDDYVKASKHVPDHPLTLVKKGIIKEGDTLRDDNALKDIKAKDVLSQLGISFEFKPAKSGTERVFITDPIPDVLEKLKNGEWKKYGSNPENTIKKFEKSGKLITIFADGKDLPRAIVTNKVEEKLQIRKVVSNSLDPYMK